MDEAAHFLSETEGPAVAERVWEALMPSTSQFGDAARIIVASTPWGQAGLFADLYQQARYHALLSRAFQERPALVEFEREEHEALLRRFCSMDRTSN